MKVKVFASDIDDKNVSISGFAANEFDQSEYNEGKKFAKIREKAAVVLKNEDGTHGVISIIDKSDEDRIKSYVEDEGCEVVCRCKNTAEADEYIESNKLDRAY